jgi:uncharacterized protein DUF6328
VIREASLRINSRASTLTNGIDEWRVSVMRIERKLKMTLDESRLMMLGAQVFFGFQFNATFQDAFEDLPFHARVAICVALVLMMFTIALFIAPSMQHRIIEQGQATNRILSATTLMVGLALLPFGITLGIDLFVSIERHFGITTGLWTGALISSLALLSWFGLELIIRARRKIPMREQDDRKPTPLDVKIEQMLTEARLIIPGAQALLGFQLAVTLTHAFEQIPAASKLVHAGALCCVALCIILLLTPASLHRISFGGEDSQTFLRLGSAFVISAPLPLAIGMAADMYVAIEKAIDAFVPALSVSIFTAVMLLGFWYAYPLIRRRQLQRAEPAARGRARTHRTARA